MCVCHLWRTNTGCSGSTAHGVGEGLSADVYKLCQIHPLPQGLAQALLPYDRIVFAEEGVRSGGIGEHLAALLQSMGFRGTYRHAAASSKGLTHATAEELRARFGLDAGALCAALKEGYRENQA